MQIKFVFISILLMIAGLIVVRSDFFSVVHADMMAETPNMDCTSSSPCFLTNTSEAAQAIPQVQDLFLGLLMLFIIATEIVVMDASSFFYTARERKKFSLLFCNFYYDYIRHGIMSPKLDCVA